MTGNMFPEQIKVSADKDDQWPVSIRFIDDVGSTFDIYLTNDRLIELKKGLKSPAQLSEDEDAE